MPSHSPISPADPPPITPEEETLRDQLAVVLDQTRVCMAAVPDLGYVTAPEELHHTAGLLDRAAALLSEAVQLNAALRNLEGLSAASAMASGGASVAIAAVADVISILQACLDERLAA